MAAFHRNVLVLLGILGLLVAPLWGCGDARVSTNVDQSRNTDDRTVPRLSDEYFMVAAGANQLIGNVTETVPIKVYLYSKKTGEPIVDQTVAYEILGDSQGDGEALATLSAFNGTTNADGGASINLRLGARPGMVSVRAAHQRSNAVDFQVDIRALETGNLELTLINTGQSIMDLRDIDVRLYRNGDVRCADFLPFEARDPGELSSVVVPNVHQKASFSELGTRERFLVTAVARGEMDQIAAAGCLDNIVVYPNEVRRQELLLQLVPLNPVGQYDAVSHWDFSQALADSGSVGSVIMSLLNVFDNPGQALYNAILSAVRNFVGGLISSGIDLVMNALNLDTMLINAINNAIESNDTLRKIRDAGRDLRDVVANLEVHSILTISRMSSKFDLRGTDNWLGITLYWRWNCNANSPPDCGAINLQVDPDGRIGELGILSSEWDGRLVAYNQLQIDRHPISLNYGRLIMYVLNEVILPQVTGGSAHSMGEAMDQWICGGLGRAVTGSDGEICVDLAVWRGCLYDHQISGFCSSVIGTVFGLADLLVSNLELDIRFSVAGEGTVLETNSDGLVDVIRNGTFEGFIQNTNPGQGSASPITATWEATQRATQD